VIGSNRKCSTETVGALLDDFAARRLTRFADRGGLEKLIAERAGRAGGLDCWNRMHTAEQRAGAEGGRPRRKFVSLEAMLNTLDESA
jgi:ferredoxin--NADP+ reductase